MVFCGACRPEQRGRSGLPNFHTHRPGSGVGSQGHELGLHTILEALAQDLAAHGTIDGSECVIAGTFMVANKEAPTWERPRVTTGRRAWGVTNASGLPCAVHTAMAHSHEALRVEVTRTATNMREDPDTWSRIVLTTVICSIRRTWPRALN